MCTGTTVNIKPKSLTCDYPAISTEIFIQEKRAEVL